MAEIVQPVASDALVEETKNWFVQLGFALISIFPADDPREAVIEGHGCRLRLLRGSQAPAARLRLSCAAAGGAPRILTAPNGTIVEVVKELDPPLPLPPLQEALFISRLHAEGEQCDGREEIEGRAGMMYRDLIPSRLGGRFIASHIRIPQKGPVPDMVHFHVCRFQMIFCLAGSVLLVYEDQGVPFWLRAGDCVLQPPGIRHRVLESSDGLEVLEIGSPAEHLTAQDLEMSLPTAVVNAEREWPQEYDGAPQRFVRHDASAATVSWLPHSSLAGWEYRDTGIAAATKGLASCIVSRSCKQQEGQPAVQSSMLQHDAELVFRFVLRGECTLSVQSVGEGVAPSTERLCRSDSIVVPAGVGAQIMSQSEDCELIEILLSADVQFSAK